MLLLFNFFIFFFCFFFGFLFIWVVGRQRSVRRDQAEIVLVGCGL